MVLRKFCSTHVFSFKYYSMPNVKNLEYRKSIKEMTDSAKHPSFLKCAHTYESIAFFKLES